MSGAGRRICFIFPLPRERRSVLWPLMVELLRYGLGLAVIAFSLAAYLAGTGHLRAHRFWASLATILTVGVGLALIVFVNIVHGADRESAGIISPDWVSGWMILAHRLVAGLVFVVMLLQAWWGWRGRLHRHRKTGVPFLIAYWWVYISGWFFFVPAGVGV